MGSHFVDQAVRLGHEVTVFDRFPDNMSRNLEHQRGKIRFVTGEFANPEILSSVLEKQDIVYHFICATNPAESWANPDIEITENLISSIRLFELAVDNGVRKIVFPSSGGTVYGSQEDRITEATVPRPFSPYGIAKLATEHFLNYFTIRSGLAADIYRIGNAYGPRQPVHRAQGVISVWMWEILHGREIQVYGDTETKRDYVHVEDIAFLLTHSLKDPDSSGLYNLGTGVGMDIIGLLDLFRSTIDDLAGYTIHPRRSSDNLSIILDSSRLLSNFRDFRFQKLADKIPETWEHFKQRFQKR